MCRAGQTGPTGDKGSRGDPGTPGVPGKDGQAGQPGQPGMEGSSRSPARQGLVWGEVTWQFSWALTCWVFLFMILGPKGDPGISGTPGAPGLPGPKGSVGGMGLPGMWGLGKEFSFQCLHMWCLWDESAGETHFTEDVIQGDVSLTQTRILNSV